jgi:hypothetical protein
LVDEGDELTGDLWAPSVATEESVARLMTTHLEESLQVPADDRLEGSWVYSGGSFERSPAPRA